MLILLILLLEMTVQFSLANAAEPVKIGILAYRSKPQTLAQWQPLAEVLKKAIPDRDFVVEALTLPELDIAVATRQLDFVLTNPGHYVLLSRRNSLSSPLATLAIEEQGQVLSVFGGVIFTRAETAGIDSLADLKGKTIATTGAESLAGYQAQAYELKQTGIRLPQDAKLLTTGMPQDNVVNEVLAGRAEVGFVRTNVLENMAREGKLNMTQIKILNSQKLGGFPEQVSTRLYPEWPFAALPHIDENLARHVVAALFLMEQNTTATKAMGIHGFIVPADYTTVADMLRELRMPPFEETPEFTLQDVWILYRWQLVSAMIVSGLIVLLLLRLLWTKRKLDTAHRLELQQNQELQENKNQLQSTLNAIPDLLFEVGLSGCIYDYHSPRTDLLVAPPDVFLGKLFYDVLPPDASNVCATAISEAHEKGCSVGKQYRIATCAWKFWFELSVSSKPVDMIKSLILYCLHATSPNASVAEESFAHYCQRVRKYPGSHHDHRCKQHHH